VAAALWGRFCHGGKKAPSLNISSHEAALSKMNENPIENVMSQIKSKHEKSQCFVFPRGVET